MCLAHMQHVIPFGNTERLNWVELKYIDGVYFMLL